MAEVRIAAGAFAPRGAFSSLRLASRGLGALTWDECDFTWDSDAAHRSWNGMEGVAAPMIGVYGDVELRATAWTAALFAEVEWRGPAGFAPFSPFRPGDYGYRRAAVHIRLSSTGGVGDELVIGGARLFADVPDVFDKGTVMIPPEGGRILFARTFNVTPEVAVKVIGGEVLGDVQVLARDALGFNVACFAFEDGAPMAAELSWIAQGY